MSLHESQSINGVCVLQDLRSVVERMCRFLGKDLTEEQMASVVEHSTFRTMKQNPQANYKTMPDSLLDHNKGTFMRKGMHVTPCKS